MNVALLHQRKTVKKSALTGWAKGAMSPRVNPVSLQERLHRPDFASVPWDTEQTSELYMKDSPAPPPEWIQLFVWLNLQQGQWHEVCFHHWAGSLMRFTLNINSWQLQVDIQIRTHRYTYCSCQRTSTVLKNWKDSNITVSAFGMLSIYLITQSPATLDTPVQLMINTSTSNNQSRGRSSV